MRILAIRLSEVGCFSKPVALEGFDAGLNVLCGPNEAGKSTVLAALRLVFELPHKTAHRDVEALRPHSGGAPLIEVDFALHGATWRIRKRYLASKMAELTNLGTGQVSRGADAEDTLVQLLNHAGGRASLPLLWASQGDALTPEPPSIDAAATLKRAISAEISAAVGGSEARHVRETVRAELEQFLTAHKPPRPKGEYDAAIKMRARLAGDLELALGRRDAALSRLDRLAGLKSQEAQLCDPRQQAALLETQKIAGAAASAAREAVQKQRAAAEAVSAAEARLDLARSRRDRLIADLKAMDVIVSELAADQDETRERASAAAAAEGQAAEAREARDAARSALAEADRELKAAMEAERRLEAQHRLAELQDIQSAAESAIAAGIKLKSELDAMRVTPDSLRTLRAEADAVRRLEDRLAAAAPKVTISYAPGAEARIQHNGVPFAAGAHVVGAPLVLTIDGIGTIEIAPGASQDADSAREDMSRHRAALQRALDAAGVAGLEAAEVQLAERQCLEAEISEARIRLSALVPGGMSKLKAEIDTMSARAGDAMCDATVRDRGDIERDIDHARQAAHDASVADDAAQRQLAREREAGARHAATASGRLDRLAKLEAALPPPAARDAALAELTASAAEGERALHAAVREHAAWRDQAPDPVRLSALESEATRAAEACRAHDRQRDEVRRTVASLEGELRADRNDDVEAKVAELEGALAAAAEKLSRLDDEVEALQLLDAELQSEEAKSRDAYLKPVTDRLSPMASLVFPGAELSLAENFAPVRLQRMAAEPISALSGGTQEQIAVLVRLAMGRLMSDAGHAIPVILDDALVYSDDERILSMFRALLTAAASHQIIVLTCRSRAFASLDAHRLTIAPWLHQGEHSDPRLLSISA